MRSVIALLLLGFLTGCTVPFVAQYDFDLVCKPSEIQGQRIGWDGNYGNPGENLREFLCTAQGVGFDITCVENTIQYVHDGKNETYFCSTSDNKSVRVRVEWQHWEPK